jgi:hypothetical protein
MKAGFVEAGPSSADEWVKFLVTAQEFVCERLIN